MEILPKMTILPHTPILVRINGKLTPVVYHSPHTQFHVVRRGPDEYFIVHEEQIVRSNEISSTEELGDGPVNPSQQKR